MAQYNRMMDHRIDENAFCETLGRPILMDIEMPELHLFFHSFFLFLAARFCSAGEAIVGRQTQRT